MSRYYDVGTEAALYESSDEENNIIEECKNTPNKFGLKFFSTHRLICEDIFGLAQSRSPIPPLDTDIRITPALQRLHYNRELSHIAQQTPSTFNDNYMRIVQENNVDSSSRKETENREEAGCSLQAVQRTNVSDEHALSYRLDRFSENHMIIFNHENFLADTRREGSARDVAALRKTFEPLRFSVTVHNDLEEAELFTTLKQFSKQDFRRCGCICVAILTHGSDHGFLEAFDIWYSERAVFACFNALTNSTLTDKPIIFLIQACRGRNLSHRVPVPGPDITPNIQLDSGNVQNAGLGLSLPAESNMIIFHSSFFGKASARDRREGSWFIQTVCEQIELHAASEDLEAIFLRVRNVVAREKEAGGGKQMPMSTSGLTKRLFLK